MAGGAHRDPAGRPSPAPVETGGPGPSLPRQKAQRRPLLARPNSKQGDLDQHPGAAERRPLARVFDRRCLAWDWHGECMGKFGCASGELLLPRRFMLAISPEWNVWPTSQGNASALGRGAKQINGPPCHRCSRGPEAVALSSVR